MLSDSGRYFSDYISKLVAVPSLGDNDYLLILRSGKLVRILRGTALQPPAAGTTGDIQINNSGSLGALTPADGISTWLVNPTSSNLRTAISDNPDTGSVYFTGDDLKTPAAGDLRNTVSVPGAHPGYVSTRWYAPLDTGSPVTAGSAISAIDTIYCIPATIKSPATANALGIHITNAGTSASVKLAIYSNSTTTKRPGNLLGHTSALSVSGTGDLTGATTSTVDLPPGAYWFCSLWTWSAAPSAACVSGSGYLDYVGKVGGSSLSNAIWSSLIFGTKYTTSGLYTSGFPNSLSGLTTDVNDQFAVIGWKQN